MTRAAIYTRLSNSREGETSTQRQEADARAFADRHGMTVEAVHTDVGFSAFKSLERPGFEAALKSLLAGEVDVLICLEAGSPLSARHRPDRDDPGPARSLREAHRQRH